jgi:hypothetical protein
MRGPTAVGTACVSHSWTVLDQVGTEICHRKILPILEPTHRGWGGWGPISKRHYALLHHRCL